MLSLHVSYNTSGYTNTTLDVLRSLIPPKNIEDT